MLYLNDNDPIVFVEWDYKEQPNVKELSQAINHTSKHGEVKCIEIETNTDQFAIGLYPSIGTSENHVKDLWENRFEYYEFED